MIEYFNEAKKKKKTKPEQDTVINNPNKDLEIFAPFIFGRQYMNDYRLLFSPKGVDTKYWENSNNSFVIDQNDMNFMDDKEDYIIKDVDNYRFISIRLFFDQLTNIDKILTKDKDNRIIYGTIGIVVKKEYLNEYNFKLNKKYISNIYKKYITETFFNPHNRSIQETKRKESIQSLPFGFNIYNGNDILFKSSDNININNIKSINKENKTIYNLSNSNNKDILINYFTNKTNEPVSFMSSCSKHDFEKNIKLFNDIGFESDFEKGKSYLKSIYKNEESNEEKIKEDDIENKNPIEDAKNKEEEIKEDNKNNKQEINNEDIKKKLMLLANKDENKYNEFINNSKYEIPALLTIYSDYSFNKLFKNNDTNKSLDDFISYIASDENLLKELDKLTAQIPKENNNITKNEIKENNNITKNEIKENDKLDSNKKETSIDEENNSEEIRKISKNLEELGNLNFETYNFYINTIKTSKQQTRDTTDKNKFIEINNIDELLIDKSSLSKKNDIENIILNNKSIWDQLITEISKKETFSSLLNKYLNEAKSIYNKIEEKIKKLYDLDVDQFNTFLKDTDKDKFNIISNGRSIVFLDTFKTNYNSSYKNWIKTLSTDDNQKKLNDLIDEIEKNSREKEQEKQKLIEDIEKKLNELSLESYGTQYYNAFIDKYAQEPKSYLKKTSLGETYYSIKSKYENLCKGLIDRLINNDKKSSYEIIEEIEYYIKKANQDKKEKEQELKKAEQEKNEKEDKTNKQFNEFQANKKQLEDNINYFLNSKNESGNFIWNDLNATINKILINLTNIFNYITEILKKDDFKENIQKSNSILSKFYSEVKNIKIENNNPFTKFYEICQKINILIDASKDKFKSENLNINDNDTEASIDLSALESIKETTKNKTKDDQNIENFNQTILNIFNLFKNIQEISKLKELLITNIINEYNKLYNTKK